MSICPSMHAAASGERTGLKSSCLPTELLLKNPKLSQLNIWRNNTQKGFPGMVT